MGQQAQDKRELRAALRQMRRDHVAALPASMRGLVFHRPPSPLASALPEGSIVGLYHATPDEAPTRAYAKWLIENGRRVALPWFSERAGAMQFRAWSDPYEDSDLTPGPWNALQPEREAEELTPDTVMVPLVGFTADGARLGQGGGHYDRWLAAHPQVRAIGLAWDCQKLDALPLEPHDRMLDAVVTPTRLYGDL